MHNHHASVASLRLLFTFTPERRSACLRNRCSPSPEYPLFYLGYAYAKQNHKTDALAALQKASAIDGPFQGPAKEMAAKINAAGGAKK